jgi:hypothetical protein
MNPTQSFFGEIVMETNDEKIKKKTYHSPDLRVYGDIRDLTESSSTTKGAEDGAASYGNPLKTGG